MITTRANCAGFKGEVLTQTIDADTGARSGKVLWQCDHLHATDVEAQDCADTHALGMLQP